MDNPLKTKIGIIYTKVKIQSLNTWFLKLSFIHTLDQSCGI